MTATALLVDWGGVLTRSVADSHRAWCECEDVDGELFDTVLRDLRSNAPKPLDLVETGSLATDEFERILAARLRTRTGAEVSAPGLLNRIFDCFTLDESMLEIVRRAREAGVRTGLVTNSWGSATPWKTCGLSFDSVVVSCRVQLRKPDRRIYELAAAEVGVDAEQCVFVDDARANVDGAVAARMVGIHHTDPATTRKEVEARLGIG